MDNSRNNINTSPWQEELKPSLSKREGREGLRRRCCCRTIQEVPVGPEGTAGNQGSDDARHYGRLSRLHSEAVVFGGRLAWYVRSSNYRARHAMGALGPGVDWKDTKGR